MRLLGRIVVGAGICAGAAVGCAPGAWAAVGASASASAVATPTASAPPATCDDGDLQLSNETGNGGVTTVYSTSSLAVDTVELSNDSSSDCPDAGFSAQVFPSPSGSEREPTLEWRVGGGSWSSAYLAWEDYSSGDPGWQTGTFTFGLPAHGSRTIEIGLRFPSSAADNAFYFGTVSYTADGTSLETSFGSQEAWSLIDTPGVTDSGSGKSGGGSGSSGGTGSSRSQTSADSSSASPVRSATASPSPTAMKPSPTPDPSQSASVVASTVSAAAPQSTVTTMISPRGVTLLADTHPTPSDRLSFTAAAIAVVAFTALAAVPLMRRSRALPRRR
jgi:hypothetical protein